MFYIFQRKENYTSLLTFLTTKNYVFVFRSPESTPNQSFIKLLFTANRAISLLSQVSTSFAHIETEVFTKQPDGLNVGFVYVQGHCSAVSVVVSILSQPLTAFPSLYCPCGSKTYPLMSYFGTGLQGDMDIYFSATHTYCSLQLGTQTSSLTVQFEFISLFSNDLENTK